MTGWGETFPSRFSGNIGRGQRGVAAAWRDSVFLSLARRGWRWGRSCLGDAAGQSGAVRCLRWYYGGGEVTPAELTLHLAILLLPFVPRATLPALALMPAVYYAVWALAHGERFSRHTPADIPLLAFFAWGALATLTSVYPLGSLRDLAINFSALGLFFVVTRVATRDSLPRLLMTLFAVASLVAMYGIYQYVVGVPAQEAWYDVKLHPNLQVRVYSTLGNPNVLAEYLGLVFPFVLAYLWSERAWSKRIVYALLGGSMGLGILFTYSRGGWLGLAVSVAVFLVCQERRLLWFLPVGALLLYTLAPPAVVERLATVANPHDAANAHRLGVWLASLAMLRDHWLTGVGLGHRAFLRVYPEYKLQGRFAWHSHSLFLEQAVELGVVGFALFLWLLVSVYRAGWEALRVGSSAEARSRALVAGGLGAVSGTLVHGVVENILYMPAVTITFWTVVAFLLVAAGMRSTRAPEGKGA